MPSSAVLCHCKPCKGWGGWGGERRAQSRRTFLGSTRLNCALEVGLRCNALLARACSLQSIALPVLALHHTPQGSPMSLHVFAGGRPGLLLSACIRAARAAQAHGCGEPRARACKKATAQASGHSLWTRRASASGRPRRATQVRMNYDGYFSGFRGFAGGVRLHRRPHTSIRNTETARHAWTMEETKNQFEIISISIGLASRGTGRGHGGAGVQKSKRCCEFCENLSCVP